MSVHKGNTRKKKNMWLIAAEVEKEVKQTEGKSE